MRSKEREAGESKRLWASGEGVRLGSRCEGDSGGVVGEGRGRGGSRGGALRLQRHARFTAPATMLVRETPEVP